ncbi:MAG: TraB/GumN family protein [Gammaproteobacteria bacterium]|nr:TraB/GumN family protein [Gammaproteobacteria bacterium]
MRKLLQRQGILLACLALLLAAAAARADRLPLWEVEGAHNHVSILGSIHFLRADAQPLPASIMAAYERADILMMEIRLDDIDPQATQAMVQRLAIDPQGRKLAQLLGPADHARATTMAKAIDLDLGLLDDFEPWFAAITITQLQLAKLGYDAASGVERQLVRAAQRDGKEIRGLETVQQQLRALDALSPAAQRAFLLETLEEATTLPEQVERIISAWQQGDTATLDSEFLDQLRTQPELYRRIVVDRNRDWARKLELLLGDRRDYLVVVGTLHLVGEDSLISLLERAGHKPRQLHEVGPRTDSNGTD